MSKCIDMTGWTMSEHGIPDSRLTVIKRVENSKDGRAMWLCECGCEEHNQIVVSSFNLRRVDGRATKSCGCLQREKASSAGDHRRRYNKYLDEIFEDEHGKYRIGFTSNTNKEFYVDIDDYDKVKNYCWRENIDNTGYHYLVTRDGINTGLRMHNLIAGKYYDHEDRNALNNRKYNLRPSDSSENARNKSLQKNNTSGITGVIFDKSCNKWRAYIRINHKMKYVGYCNSKEDAIRARLQAEAKYYGDFAPQRHLFEKYGIEREENYEERVS